MPNSVNIISKEPYFYPAEERNEEGEVITPAVYDSLKVKADVQVNGNNYSGDHFVPLPEDADDEAIKAAVLALYGV